MLQTELQPQRPGSDTLARDSHIMAPFAQGGVACSKTDSANSTPSSILAQ